VKYGFLSFFFSYGSALLEKHVIYGLAFVCSVEERELQLLTQ
jgi:hypothetical protein